MSASAAMRAATWGGPGRSRWALEGKLLAHPGRQFRPGNPRVVVRPGLRLSVAAAFRALSAVRMPAGRSLPAA